ncbi:MAG: tRNA (5-methylaminomethyl-2-thiouridine)(34)-methyltransferase MnmD [Stigonema ocellatum SAG 48.90 = DSM 106950]|nr:tRNA (5-methylaminomethyl-2-thiouridine)(34)-methyltransferase MnmD [Stigonema ocellatum SAG 48.90 = DSM 106950]
MTDFDNFTPQATADGSFTFFSKEFAESFHSHYGARQESFFKFVVPTQLAKKANKPVLRLLDVCYGLGYNTAAALQTIWAVNPTCYVEVIGLEVNAAVPQAAIAHNLFDSWGCEHTQILNQLAFEHQAQTERCAAKLFIGDARSSIQLVNVSDFRADAIFLDPFSPPQCPHLWTVEFIKKVTLSLDEEGTLATYSCAAAVRTAFLAAGLQIGSTPPVGRRSPGTVAAFVKAEELEDLGARALSLSQAEKEHLLTRAAIPYRDPELSDPADIILRRRQLEQQACSLEPTSRWRKRWLCKSQAE